MSVHVINDQQLGWYVTYGSHCKTTINKHILHEGGGKSLYETDIT